MKNTKCLLAGLLVFSVLVTLYFSTSFRMTSHSFDNIKSLIYATAQKNDSELVSRQGENPHYPNLVSKNYYVQSCSYTWMEKTMATKAGNRRKVIQTKGHSFSNVARALIPG